MHILYYNEGEDPSLWLPELEKALPEAEIRLWQDGDDEPADYALVWNPPAELFENRTGLKAVFNLAAGVDSLLGAGFAIPAGVPIFRLEDAGMAVQMAEYAVHAVLRYFRRFDEYEKQAQQRLWKPLDPCKRQDFTIGIMGMGIMGTAIAQALAPFGFPLKGWSRQKKISADVTGFYGNDQLERFLENVRVLICVLPLTTETAGILNRNHFRHLQKGAYLVNLGRGSHLVEKDLLEALDTGQIKAATLDVAVREPLPPDHPFWERDTITVTPHIGGLTFCKETVEQVAGYIRAFEKGQTPASRVNREQGY